MNFMSNLVRPKKTVSDIRNLDGITNDNDAILVYYEDLDSIIICEDSENFVRIAFCSEIKELNEDSINGLHKLGFEFDVEYVESNWNNI